MAENKGPGNGLQCMAGSAQVQQDRGGALTIRLRVIGPWLSVRDGDLARKLLLEVSTETGREAVGRRIPKAGGHAHRAGTKRGYKTHTSCVHSNSTHTTHTHRYFRYFGVSQIYLSM